MAEILMKRLADWSKRSLEEALTYLQTPTRRKRFPRWKKCLLKRLADL